MPSYECRLSDCNRKCLCFFILDHPVFEYSNSTEDQDRELTAATEEQIEIINYSSSLPFILYCPWSKCFVINDVTRLITMRSQPNHLEVLLL